jgi:hypothetical protein
LLFGLLLDRVGLGVLAASAGLGLASTAALLALHVSSPPTRPAANSPAGRRDACIDRPR